MNSTSTAVAVMQSNRNDTKPKGCRKEGRDLRPGSAQALRRGCQCSTVANGLTPDMAVMSGKCPLHRGLTEWPVKPKSASG